MKRVGLLALILLAACSVAEKRPQPVPDVPSQPTSSNASRVSPDTASESIDADAAMLKGEQEQKPVSAGPYKVVLIPDRDSVSHLIKMRVQLVDSVKPDRIIDVGTVDEREYGHRVLRADTTSIVYARYDDYGFENRVKLFLDPASKRMTKKLDFARETNLDAFTDNELSVALKIPVGVAHALKQPEMQSKPGEQWESVLPAVMKSHPMPQPTYADFARLRNARVGDGYDSANTDLGEDPTALQYVGNRIWFGKRFYDGEGLSGIGGVGFFDTTSFKYTFLDIPEVIGSSVSALLVEDSTVWIALVVHPEGADHSEGLLRHDLRTHVTTRYPIDRVIHQIQFWHDRLYLATDDGLWILADGKVVDKYLVEPGADGKDVLIQVKP